jgi:hypothetical protein
VIKETLQEIITPRIGPRPGYLPHLIQTPAVNVNGKYIANTNMAGVLSCTRGPSIFSAVFSALFVMLVSENKINKIQNCRM